MKKSEYEIKMQQLLDDKDVHTLVREIPLSEVQEK